MENCAKNIRGCETAWGRRIAANTQTLSGRFGYYTIDAAKEKEEKRAPYPIRVTVGGATVFVLEVSQFLKV